MTQICSAWVLVIISIDRWIRTRFPHKSKTICTPKKALIAVSILIVCDIAILSPMLTPLFGMLLPGVALVACGPNVSQKFYLNFYYFTWTIMQVRFVCFFFCLKSFKKIWFIILIDIY
jgi:hypothetical protein